jgi:hypothetical protein
MQKLGNVFIDPAKTYFRVRLDWYCELVLPTTPENYKLIENMSAGGGLAVVDFNAAYHAGRAVDERVRAVPGDLRIQIVTGKFLIEAMLNEQVYLAEQEEARKKKAAEDEAKATETPPVPANDDGFTPPVHPDLNF